MVPSIMWLRPTLAKDDWQRFMSLGAGCSLSRWEFFRSLRFEVIGGIVQLSASHRRQEAMSNFSDFWLSVLLVMMRPEQNSVIHATSNFASGHAFKREFCVNSFVSSFGRSLIRSFILSSFDHSLFWRHRKSKACLISIKPMDSSKARIHESVHFNNYYPNQVLYSLLPSIRQSIRIRLTLSFFVLHFVHPVVYVIVRPTVYVYVRSFNLLRPFFHRSFRSSIRLRIAVRPSVLNMTGISISVWRLSPRAPCNVGIVRETINYPWTEDEWNGQVARRPAFVFPLMTRRHVCRLYERTPPSVHRKPIRMT